MKLINGYLLILSAAVPVLLGTLAGVAFAVILQWLWSVAS